MICPQCQNETLTMGRCNICGYAGGQVTVNPREAARRLLDQVELAPRAMFIKKTASQRFRRIQVVLPPNVLEKLNLLASDKKHSRSIHIERAVRFYLTVLGFDLTEK